MKKITCIMLVLAIAPIALIYGQRPTIVLTFTGVSDTSYLRPDSVKVKNLTQGGDTVLFYPDTTLVLDFLGINEKPVLQREFRVLQVFPNPVIDRATFCLFVPEKDRVSLTVTDILGRKIVTLEMTLEKGEHSFRFTPAGEKIYLLTAIWKGAGSSIKLLNFSRQNSGVCTLDYAGSILTNPTVKSIPSTTDFLFSPGDELLFIGNADTLESGILDSPETNQDYVFQFATNIPCPGLDSVYYEGQWYHTIQIFSQCWMKENLNVGTMIPGTQAQTNNGILEKYCYANAETICSETGGIYTWEEMMEYSTLPGARGICPEGWHVPIDEEWKILEGIADSQFGIGNTIWNSTNLRGFDVGFNLKSIQGWSFNGDGPDLYGFTALAGGYWWQSSFFEYTNFGIFWTSTPNEAGLPYYRGMRMDMHSMARMLNTYGPIGYSVRCLKD